MKKNIFVKVLAVFMSFALLHNLVGLPASASSTLAERRMTQAILAARVPVLALNDGTPLHEINPELADKEALEAVPIVGEMYELRDAVTRHFRHADDTFSAAIFPQPVHFLAADGTWQDINNTLHFDGQAFVPVASDLDVRIPQNFARGQQMTISQDGFTLGFGVSSRNVDVQLSAQASMIEESMQVLSIESVERSVAEVNANIMTAENLTASVLYADLFAGASMEQIVTPSGVETSIVIAQSQDNLAFLFDLDLGGLVAVPQEDGSIFFFAPADVVNVIAIERPVLMEEITIVEPEEIAEDSVHYNENEEVSLEDVADENTADEVDVLQEIYSVEEIELERETIVNLELEITHREPILLGMPIEGAEPIFILQAPVMIDADGEMALAQMGFAEDGTLVIQANAEFMSTAAFPVTISPSLEVSVITNIRMTRVSSMITVGNTHVGRGSSGAIHRAYVQFDLPNLPSGSVVLESIFHVNQGEISNFGAGNFLSLFAIPRNGTVAQNHPNWRHDRLNWSINSVTWNNQPFHGNTSNALRYLVDFSPIPNDNNVPHEFNITNTVRNWYENNSNNGLLFTTFHEGAPSRVTLSSTSNINANRRPYVVIVYTTNVSLQPHLTYEIYEMGRSGTAFVNVHNGNMTWVHEDISMPGERLPIQISHIYNTSRANFSGLYIGTQPNNNTPPNPGIRLNPGFRLNILEQLTRVDVDNREGSLWSRGFRYRLVDGFGVEHYFRINADGIITHVSDPTLVLTTSSGNLRIITDAEGTQRHYHFGVLGNGFLRRIQDRHGNFQNINWDTVYGRITFVEDSVGRQVIFGYNPAGFLTSMTDQAGRVTTFNHGQSNTLDITYPDGRQTRFFSSPSFEQVFVYDGSLFNFVYNTHLSHNRSLIRRIHSVDHFCRDNWIVPIDQHVFSYSETNDSGVATGHTTVRNLENINNSNHGRRDVFLFNRLGSVQSVTNRQGQTQVTNFHTSADNADDLARLNQVASSSDWLTISGNLLRNHGFEIGGHWSLSPRTGRAEIVGAAGQRTVRLQSYATNSRSEAAQTFIGRPGETYTLTADVFIPDELIGSGGASLLLEWHEGGALRYAGQNIRMTNGWERIGLTFTIPTTAQANRSFSVVLMLHNAAGEVFFDNVQLEQSGGAGLYNHIENSDFRFNTTSWSFTGQGGLRNYTGQNFMAFNPLPGNESRLSQTVRLNAFAGETLIIGGYAYAYATAAGEGRSFHIQAIVTYADGTSSEPIIIPFDPHVQQTRQRAIGYYTLTENAVSIRYTFVYGNQPREAAFTNAFLYVAPFGTHIEYNNDGLPEEMSSADGSSTQFSYNNSNQVNRIEQRHGGSVTNSLRMYYTAGDLTSVVDEKTGMVTSLIHDNFGNVTSRTITNGDLSLTETMVYTPCGNFVREHVDFNDGRSIFTWDVLRGLLLSATDPNGNTITYTYCPTTDQLLSVSGRANPGQIVTTSFDVQDTIATITRSHRGGTYTYRYDSRGRTTHAMVGNVALVTNTYNNQNNQLIQQLFANGDRFEPVFDNRGRMTAEYWNNQRTVTYYYNENDRLSQLIDHTGGEDVTQRFDYDFAGRLVRVSGSDGLTTHITYDANGAPTLLRTELNGDVIHDSLFLTNMQGQSMDASFFALGASLSYAYDGLNRPVQRSLIMPNAAVSTTLIFQQDEETGATRNLVEIFRNELFGGQLLHEWTYEYDNAGNIIGITDQHGRETRFAFDGLNRLTSETIDGILWEYEFDAGGNLTRITRDGVVEHTFSYGNNNWPDQLTAFDGRTITYDRMGNPLTYGNYSFTWERGRLLTRIYYNGELLHRFSYDSAGRRVSRTSYDGEMPVTTRFYYMGQQVIRQCDGTNTLDFTWDADGRPVGFTHNGTPYFYLLNLLGDVVAIVDADGNIVAEYTYDAWGNVTVFEGERSVEAHGFSMPQVVSFAEETLENDFIEQLLWAALLVELGFGGQTASELAAQFPALGITNRADLMAYHDAHGAGEDSLEMWLNVVSILGMTEWFISDVLFSVITDSLSLEEIGFDGPFYPFASYYLRVVQGLLDISPDFDVAMLVEILTLSFVFMSSEENYQIMQQTMASVDRENLHHFLRARMGMTHEQARDFVQSLQSDATHDLQPLVAYLAWVLGNLVSQLQSNNSWNFPMRLDLVRGAQGLAPTALLQLWLAVFGAAEPPPPPRPPSDPGAVAQLNPIRYRGKFYCDSMGWYWMQTRFYNPQWRRFINADTFFIAGDCNLSALTASNMFAYANGNPVMMVDPDGRSAVRFGQVMTAVMRDVFLVLFGLAIAIAVVIGAFYMSVALLGPVLAMGVAVSGAAGLSAFWGPFIGLGIIITAISIGQWLINNDIFGDDNNPSYLIPIDGEGQFIFGEENANASALSGQHSDVFPETSIPLATNATTSNTPERRIVTNVSSAVLFYSHPSYIDNYVELSIKHPDASTVNWTGGNAQITPSPQAGFATIVTATGGGSAVITAEVKNAGGVLLGTGVVRIYSLGFEGATGVTRRTTVVRSTPGGTSVSSPQKNCTCSSLATNEPVAIFGRFQDALFIWGFCPVHWFAQGFVRRTDIFDLTVDEDVLAFARTSTFPSEVHTFAAVVYGEVVDERFPREEWIAVAWSIRNRVECRNNWGGWAGFPNTFYEVLTEPDNVGGFQYHAYRSPDSDKYFWSMNFTTGRTIYPGRHAPAAQRPFIIDSLRIAIGVYFNWFYLEDLSRGSNLFWQSARGPYDWRRPFVRADTPLASSEGAPNGWAHTFWVVLPPNH